jgi:hypothetical protein
LFYTSDMGENLKGSETIWVATLIIFS